MNILCSTDDKYVPYCGVMLTSLFENNKEEEISVYVLTGGLNPKNIADFQKLADMYGQKIHIVKVKEETFDGCPINPETDHVSIATYYRLAVTELLPQDIDKILYLDCDMVVTGSLKELYDTDLEDYACGVVNDEAFNQDEPYNRLGIAKDPENPYFNAGMLLINLAYWRKHDVMAQCMDYIARNRSRLAYHDQDTLNGVLRTKVKYLDLKYNLQKELLFKDVFQDLSSDYQQKVLTACQNPTIVHFTGLGKPWIEDCKNPYTRLWIEYNKKSLWKDIPFVKNQIPFKDRIFKLRNEIIWRLGIKKRPYFYIVERY